MLYLRCGNESNKVKNPVAFEFPVKSSFNFQTNMDVGTVNFQSAWNERVLSVLKITEQYILTQ